MKLQSLGLQCVPAVGWAVWQIRTCVELHMRCGCGGQQVVCAFSLRQQCRVLHSGGTRHTGHPIHALHAMPKLTQALLATGSADKLVRLSRMSDGAELASLAQPGSALSSGSGTPGTHMHGGLCVVHTCVVDPEKMLGMCVHGADMRVGLQKGRAYMYTVLGGCGCMMVDLVCVMLGRRFA